MDLDDSVVILSETDGDGAPVGCLKPVKRPKDKGPSMSSLKTNESSDCADPSVTTISIRQQNCKIVITSPPTKRKKISTHKKSPHASSAKSHRPPTPELICISDDDDEDDISRTLPETSEVPKARIPQVKLEKEDLEAPEAPIIAVKKEVDTADAPTSTDKVEKEESKCSNSSGKETQKQDLKSERLGNVNAAVDKNEVLPTAIAIEDFLSTCRSVLSAHEFSVVEKRLNKKKDLLRQCDLASKRLADLVEKLRLKVSTQPTEIYVFIKKLLDELRNYCQKPKVTPVPAPVSSTSDTRASVSPRDDRKPASAKHVQRLERALKQCHRAIQKLEESECDLDDEDDSAYMRIGRYKAKCVAIYKKLAELRGCDTSLGRKLDKRFKFEGSRLPEINAKIEKFVNRQRSEGKQNFVPDFADVLTLVQQANETMFLGMSHETARQEAKETFEAVVNLLKAKRLFDDTEVMETYLIPQGEAVPAPDPIRNNPEIETKFKESAEVGAQKLNQVFDEYVQKQKDSGEAPELVPDDEASDQDDEEDEPAAAAVELDASGDNDDDVGGH